MAMMALKSQYLSYAGGLTRYLGTMEAESMNDILGKRAYIIWTCFLLRWMMTMRLTRWPICHLEVIATRSVPSRCRMTLFEIVCF